MIIILPDEIGGLVELEERLDSVDLFDELNNLQQSSVIVTFPKFKLEITIDLVNILRHVSNAKYLKINLFKKFTKSI